MTDPMPPEGATPALNPIANVTAELKGPKRGECCKGAKFELVLTVDSEVMAQGQLDSNDLTAWVLASGQCGKNGMTLSAETNGAPQPIVDGPNDTFDCNNVTQDIAAVTRVELMTTATADVTCDGPPECPCTVANTTFITKFNVSGAENGVIEVHWTIALAGQECAITTASGRITNVLFIRAGQVYDPVNDEYVAITGDPDGDGKTSYAEILKGADPANPGR
jgi:hypothetical protein